MKGGFFVDSSKNSRFSVANDCCLLRPNDSLPRPNDGLPGPNDSLLGPNKSTMRPNNSIIRCIEEETGPLFVISARAVVFLHSLPFFSPISCVRIYEAWDYMWRDGADV